VILSTFVCCFVFALQFPLPQRTLGADGAFVELAIERQPSGVSSRGAGDKGRRIYLSNLYGVQRATDAPEQQPALRDPGRRRSSGLPGYCSHCEAEGARRRLRRLRPRESTPAGAAAGENAARCSAGWLLQQAATDMEVVAAIGITIDANREPSMTFGVIMFAAVAFGSEVLWLGLISWWFLNLF
jgi:hypothetical protein